MVQLANVIWADGPTSSPAEPDKAQIREWGTWLENLTSSLTIAASAVYIRGSKSQLDAVIGASSGEVGIVVADDNENLRGIYVYEGGSWVKKLDLPVDAAEQVLALTEAARDVAIDARNAAQLAQAAAEQARNQAAGYVNDIASEKEVPIFDTVTGMALVTVQNGITTIRVNGYGASGDGGGALYVRASSQPTGEFAGLAFRSADRFMPDGSTSAANGGWWAFKEKFDAREICQRLAARLAKGDRVVIACYGDSQTDGNNTTGWSANPTSGGNALGTTDHSLDAPNAYPARVAWALGSYYRNEDLKVMNCGYGGKRIADGWAVSNFQVGVIQNCINFAGRVPDVVIISFGVNDTLDSTTDAEWINKHISETRKLCRLAMSYGVVPVIQTSDPNWRSDPAGYDSYKTAQMVDAAKAALAVELGIMLMDTGGDLKRWMNNNKDRHNYIENQDDALHGGDIWCAFKGSAVARLFMRDFVERPGSIGVQRISAFDSAFQNALGQAEAFAIKQSRDGAVYTTGHTTGILAPFGLAADLWIWNEDPDAELIYRGAGGENINSADLAAYSKPYHQIFDLTNIGTRGDRVAAGIGFSASGHGRRVDVPYRVGKLAFGLNRVRYVTGTLPFYFVGHYEIRSTSEWQEEPRGVGGSTYAAAIPVNALKGSGKLHMEVPKTSAGVTTLFMPEAPDFSNVIGLMNIDRARLYLRAFIPQNTGVILGWTPSYVDQAGPRDNKSFMMLYKSGATAVQLYVGTYNNGTVTFTQLASGNIAQTPDADGAEKYLILMIRNGDNQDFSIFEGWDFSATQIAAVSLSPDALAFPMGFVMGGLFVNNPSGASGFFNPKIFDYFGKQQTATVGVPEPSIVAP